MSENRARSKYDPVNVASLTCNVIYTITLFFFWKNDQSVCLVKDFMLINLQTENVT